MTEPLLQMHAIVKQFPGVRALDGVDLDVVPGEVHCLLGQNGAGKSTLIRILAGVDEADSGTIRFEGEEVRPAHAGLPIAFIHQNLGLVETMTVAENFALYSGYPRRGGLVDWGALRRMASEQLELLDCHGSGKVRKFAEIVAATVLCGELSLGSAIVAEEWVNAHDLLGRNRPG